MNPYFRYNRARCVLTQTEQQLTAAAVFTLVSVIVALTLAALGIL